MCLEEMTGKKVTHGAIFHHGSRRRREVEITSALRQQVEEITAAVRALLKFDALLPPVNDERCRHCSLNEICQPEALAETEKLHALREHLFDPGDNLAGGSVEGIRMKLQQIEQEALQLTEEERAELAKKLLLSLDSPSEAEIREDWLTEAYLRARDLDEGKVQPIPAEEVRRKAKALLR